MTKEIDEKLFEWVTAKKLAPGARLPATKELAKELGVTEKDVNAAVSALVYEGILERSIDKSIKGVLVSSSSRLGVMGGILSLTKEAIKRGMTPGSKVLKYEIVPAGKFLSQKLEIDTTEKVIIVERLRTVDGEPVALETSNIPHRLMPDVTPDMFEATGAAASSFDLMDNRGIHLARAVDIVSAIKIEAREAELLGLEAGDPILQRDRTTWDDQGRLAKWSRAFFKASSKYEMSLR